MKVPYILPLVSIPGYHFTAMTPTPTSTSNPTSRASPISPSACVEVSVTNYLTNGSYSVSLSREDGLECFILRYDPRPFQRNGLYEYLNMTCLDDGVNATFEKSAAAGASDELYVKYFAEDGTKIFFEIKPLLEEDWLVEDGAVYEKYFDSVGCSNSTAS
jgi:hypothetical protein